MMNFPATPTVGQQYTLGTKSWEWNGFAWDALPISDAQVAAAEASAIAADASADAAAASAATVAAALTRTIDYFSGDGSTVAFTLSVAPGLESNTQVHIDAAYQHKSEYSISGLTLTFAVAPPAGTNNIEVEIGATSQVVIGVESADNITYTASGTGAVATNVETVLRESVSVKRFGAVGDGTTEDTTKIQAAIAAVFAAGGGEVLFPVGTYLSKTIYVPSKVALVGRGAGSIIKAAADLSTTAALIQNSNIGAYTDTNIAIRELAIDGNNLGAGGTQTRLTSLIQLARVTGVAIERVKISNHQYQGIASLGCRRVSISHCDLSGMGYSGTTANGGSAIWIGSYSTDMSQDVAVRDNQIHDNNWHGLHVAANRATVKGNDFIDNKEAHIYAPRTMPDTDTSKLKIIGNTFDGVTKKDISAHAIETTARRIVIANNVIENCDHGGVAIQNTQEIVIIGNVISNVNQLDLVWSGIDIITDLTTPDQPQNITITGNRIFDDQATVTMDAAVSILNPGDSITGLSMVGNNFGETTFKTGVFVTNSKLGSGSKIKSNIGIADNPANSVFGEFSVSATGALSVTGLGFKPVRLVVHAILPGASLKKSDGWVGPSGTMYCHNNTTTATPAAYGGIGSYVVNITNGLGTAEVRGTFTSYDTDGFTLNFSVVGATAWCVFEAFPD